jgi:hypothetical protein
MIVLATAALAYQDYPVITLVGKSKLLFGQAPEDYIDPGADCYDPVANSKHSVSMSDSYSVDLRKPGTYAVKYECNGASGMKASPAKRIVIVDPKVPIL